MGKPPSSSGFFHFSLQPFFVTSVASKGPLGFPGLPANRKNGGLTLQVEVKQFITCYYLQLRLDLSSIKDGIQFKTLLITA
jgi:hypothetical protein